MMGPHVYLTLLPPAAISLSWILAKPSCFLVWILYLCSHLVLFCLESLIPAPLVWVKSRSHQAGFCSGATFSEGTLLIWIKPAFHCRSFCTFLPTLPWEQYRKMTRVWVLVIGNSCFRSPFRVLVLNHGQVTTLRVSFLFYKIRVKFSTLSWVLCITLSPMPNEWELLW